MKDYYPTMEIAKRLGVSGNSVRNMCARGDLPYVKLKVGGKFRYFVPAREFDAIIEEASQPAKPGRPSRILSVIKGSR